MPCSLAPAGAAAGGLRSRRSARDGVVEALVQLVEDLAGLRHPLLALFEELLRELRVVVARFHGFLPCRGLFVPSVPPPSRSATRLTGRAARAGSRPGPYRWVMSVGVELHRLHEEVARFGATPYLLSVTDD